MGEPRDLDPELHRRRAGDGELRWRRRSRRWACAVQWQQVEEGRANVLGTLSGRGRRADADVQRAHGHVVLGPRAVAARTCRASSPSRSSSDGRLYGLGISNMKGALACYVEAVRALQDAGVRLRGDVLIAAVCGEIEKTQYGDAQGAEYRGYAAGTRYLVSHGGVADMCILGEPTEGKVVLGHFGSLWLRISTQGNFIHTAFSEGKRDQNSILRMREVLDAVLEWIPTWEDDPDERLPRREGDRQRRRDRGRLRLARLAHAAPHRPLPRRARAADEGDGASRGGRCSTWCAALARRFPDYGVEGEVYVTAPGRRDRRGPPARRARSTRATRRCSARRPSATSRAGSPTRRR